MSTRFLIMLILIVFQIGCTPKTKTLVEATSLTYHQQVIEDYRNNQYLQLTEEELTQISFYDINPEYNCNCSFIKNTNLPTIQMATYSGKIKVFKKYGVAKCLILNKSIEVSLYLSTGPLAPKDYIFLPIIDLTSGAETYGGGRYIELKKSDIKNDTVHINFNHLYNPYCAFRDGFSCPVPPIENHLRIAIEAGEKSFGGSH